MVMNYGVYQDSLTAPSGADVSPGPHDVSSSQSGQTPQAAGDREWKGKTAFEWVSPDVRAQCKGVVGIEFDGTGLVVLGMDGDRKAGHVIDHVLVTRCEDRISSDAIADRLRSFVRHRCPDVHIVLSTQRAVVRNFAVPPVPVRQREAAARWEGQKLIPFSLKDGEALYGLHFVPAGDHGWRTTLVAVPAEDAAPILDAIEKLGWMLRSVSLVGTQQFNDDLSSSADDATAVISWSDQRGCFSVYHQRQLVFYYNLGPMPATPSQMDRGVLPETMAIWQRWTDALGEAVYDALDFHLNVNSTIPPAQLRLYGLPPETAPLLTEWQNRFPAGVVLGDPLVGCGNGLPDGVSGWLSAKPGLVAPVMAAMRGTVSIDLTPPRVRQERTLYRSERIARSVCVLSFAVCLAWTGMIWSRIAGHQAEVQSTRDDLAQIQNTPVSRKLDEVLASTARTRLLLSAATETGRAWMPWIKTALATLPDNANLNHVGIERRADRGGVVALLEGNLTPGPIPYALTYRGWFDRLRPLSPTAAPVLASERTIDVLGTKRSAFTIELMAPTSLAPVERKAP
jgi:hypothetical protein